MKILVTGGAGFIGTNFVYRMSERGHIVQVLDNLTYAGGRDNLAPVGNRVKLIRGDVCDREVVAEALLGIDTVVHFAAESHVTRCETPEGKELCYKTNVGGTEIILDEARKAGVPQFVHISTDEVYGSKPDGFFKESDKLPGDSQASSDYAKSKSLADDLAMAMAEISEVMEIVVVRMTNNFGPWQFPEKALPRWITNLLLDEKIPLWGAGSQVRDWLYAPVCCSGIEHVMKYGVPGEAYNIAANNRPEITNRRAAELVCMLMNRNPDDWILHIPDPRPDHDFRYALDCSKLEAIGWRAPQNITTQFEATIRWYVDHVDWWKSRKAEAERIYT